MSDVVPVSLQELKAKVRSMLSHARPIGEAELTNVINYGYGKAIRAALAVRPQLFLSYVDPFTIPAQTSEVDVSFFDPPLFRPVRLTANRADGRGIGFRYASLGSTEFEEGEFATAGATEVILYDVLSGMFPGTPVLVTSATTAQITVDATTGIQVGTLIAVAGSGPVETLTDGDTVPGTYRGVVTGVAGLVLSISPDLTVVPGAGVAVTPLRRRMMRFSPVLGSALTGRLYYNYRPAKLVNDADLVDPVIAEHDDMIVSYALGKAKHNVGDADGDRYFGDGQDQRSEMIQEVDPIAAGSSEALGSGLAGIRDW